MERYGGRNDPDPFSTRDMFIYPLAFVVGFKPPVHTIVMELLKQHHVSPHRVIPNTWRVLATVLTINSNVRIDLALGELLSLLL